MWLKAGVLLIMIGLLYSARKSQATTLANTMKIRFEPYNPAWRDEFERHRVQISQALSNLNPAVDHIGSTSLGSIAAKPIIDILVGLQSEGQLDECIQPLLAAGYTYLQKFTPGMPYRRFFVKLTALSSRPLPHVISVEDVLAFGRDYDSVANIHVMERGTHHWMRHIAFRDYLRAHPAARSAYESLKRRIAEMDFNDPLEYNSYKDDFIKDYQEKALAWFDQVNAHKLVGK